MLNDKIKSFYMSEVALMEHDFITSHDLLEWRAEDAQWYLAGVHEFAQAVMDAIKDGSVI